MKPLNTFYINWGGGKDNVIIILGESLYQCYITLYMVERVTKNGIFALHKFMDDP